VDHAAGAAGPRPVRRSGELTQPDAAALALGWTGWTPMTWYDWLTVAGLTPAGVGGVLLGDRAGLWLKDRGFGRQ
jgi:hypothetical protein